MVMILKRMFHKVPFFSFNLGKKVCSSCVIINFAKNVQYTGFGAHFEVIRLRVTT